VLKTLGNNDTTRTRKMTWQKTSLALILTFVIAFSLIALIQLEKNNSISFNSNSPSTSNLASWTHLGSSTFTPPIYYASAFYNQIGLQDVNKDSTSSITSNSTRIEVYNFVVANPGIQFRGICTGLGIAIGTAEFHLGVLKRAGLISFLRDGKYKRFFVSKKYSIKEMRLISLLRHENTRKIIKKIASDEIVPHKKLALHLSITSQGLTWQINQLRKEGIIKENIDGIKVSYSLNEEYVHLLPELICVIEQ
jgi:DNA-binding transcriptional ArsR family regulator